MPVYGVEHRQSGTFRPDLRVQGVKLPLSSYESPEQAAAVYDVAARVFKGLNSRLNYAVRPLDEFSRYITYDVQDILHHSACYFFPWFSPDDKTQEVLHRDFGGDVEAFAQVYPHTHIQGREAVRLTFLWPTAEEMLYRLVWLERNQLDYLFTYLPYDAEVRSEARHRLNAVYKDWYASLSGSQVNVYGLDLTNEHYREFFPHLYTELRLVDRSSGVLQWAHPAFRQHVYETFYASPLRQHMLRREREIDAQTQRLLNSDGVEPLSFD